MGTTSLTGVRWAEVIDENLKDLAPTTVRQLMAHFKAILEISPAPLEKFLRIGSPHKLQFVVDGGQTGCKHGLS